MISVAFVLACGLRSEAAEVTGLLQSSAVQVLGLPKRKQPKQTEQLTAVLSEVREQMSSGVKFSDADIDNLINTLDQSLVPALQQQRQSDQNVFNLAVDHLEVCIDHKEKRLHGTTGDLKVLQDEAASAKTKHAACRKVEFSLHAAQTLSTEFGSKSWASATGADDTVAFDSSALCSLKQSFDQNLATYAQLAPVGHISPACSSDQTIYEASMCRWSQAKTSTCSTFDECVSTVDIETVKGNLETNTDTRIDIHHALEEVKCNLRSFKSNATEEDCNAVPAPPPAMFSLNLTSPPYTSCSQDPDITNPVLPSTSEGDCASWRAQEFTDTVPPTMSPVTSCQYNCILPTGGNPAPVNASCVDESDPQNLCPFYALHHDACGSYGDYSGEVCCACGGGSPAPTPVPTPAPTLAPTPAPTTALWTAPDENAQYYIHNRAVDCDTIDGQSHFTDATECRQVAESFGMELKKPPGHSHAVITQGMHWAPRGCYLAHGPLSWDVYVNPNHNPTTSYTSLEYKSICKKR